MKMFNHKQKQNAVGISGKDKAAQWVASGMAKLQSYWATAMDRLFNKLSEKRKKVILIITCVLMSLYSSAVIAYSFNTVPVLLVKPPAAVRPLSLSRPPRAMPVGIPDYVRRIEHFRSYLDSLSHTLDGKKVRDSILQHRPGLLDSIQRIENIFCKK